jgi:hypothetical protein
VFLKYALKVFKMMPNCRIHAFMFKKKERDQKEQLCPTTVAQMLGSDQE